MTSRSWHIRSTRSFFGVPPALQNLVFLLGLLGLALAPHKLVAEDATGTKSTTAPAAKTATDTAGLNQRNSGSVTQGDEMTFQQAKVAAEMNELEERMFRLSESLKSLEPENSSRLMSGVKYARDELILHQMKEVQDVLSKLDYASAAGEQKELLTKLQRLEQLLLSADLDLQLQLQKLRLLREVLRKLDTAIKEEDRQLSQTGAAARTDEQLQGLPQHRDVLQAMIRRQTAHVQSGATLAKDGAAAETRSSVESLPAAAPTDLSTSVELLLDAQKQTRELTLGLEKQLAEVAPARQAMEAALPPLEQKSAQDALPHQQKALKALKELLDQFGQRKTTLESALTLERFSTMRTEQVQNRTATDAISDLVRQLGDSGASAIGELVRASGSMSSAENELEGRKPTPAASQQTEALASLKYARQQLAEAEQKLLNQIRAEVKKRVLEGITEMIELQAAVRQSTARLAPRVKEGSRQVLTSVAALAKSEENIIHIGDSLVALVEETEFGIALPAALRASLEDMGEVKQRLAAGDVSDEVVEAERQIEEDLKALLGALKQLPSSSSSGPSKAANLDERERELNRLVAELKMIRLLQVRVNQDTKRTDEKRAAELKNLSNDLQQKIRAIHGRQQDVHDVTDKLNSERGGELR